MSSAPAAVFEPRVLGEVSGPAVGVRVADATDTTKPATTSTKKVTVVLTLNDGDSGDVHLALDDEEVAWVARALGAGRAATHRKTVSRRRKDADS